MALYWLGMGLWLTGFERRFLSFESLRGLGGSGAVDERSVL